MLSKRHHSERHSITEVIWNKVERNRQSIDLQNDGIAKNCFWFIAVDMKPGPPISARREEATQLEISNVEARRDPVNRERRATEGKRTRRKL